MNLISICFTLFVILIFRICDLFVFWFLKIGISIFCLSPFLNIFRANQQKAFL